MGPERLERGARHVPKLYTLFQLFTDSDAHAPKKVWNAMTRHDAATHGLRRSPMRAAFQNIPRSPVRYGSTSRGAFILTYVQVQMNSRRVTRNDCGWRKDGRVSTQHRRLLGRTRRSSRSARRGLSGEPRVGLALTLKSKRADMVPACRSGSVSCRAAGYERRRGRPARGEGGDAS